MSPHRLRLAASLAAVEEAEDGGGQGVWSGEQGEALKCCRAGGLGLELGYQGHLSCFWHVEWVSNRVGSRAEWLP